jgi:zinc transporter ZupT
MLHTLIEAVVAGIVASLACGLGVLPLLIPGLDPKKHIGLGYALAGGLMFSASVYNLIYEGIKLGSDLFSLASVWPVVAGILAGALFLSITEKLLHGDDHDHANGHAHADSPRSLWGGRTGLLVFIAMTIHSIPEGVAVGTGFTAEEYGAEGLGLYIALAIAIHNIPEGLAVAIPMRSAGASLWRCFWAAVATSLPQPIAAIPAVLLAWFFTPLMPGLMGFAAGAMIFLVVLELIPEALATERPGRIAWAFTLGFCLMLLIQVLL